MSAQTVKLLNYTDIVKLLGVDRRYLVAKLSKKPDFPKPTLKVSRRTVWWSEKDIWDWASKKARQG